MKRRFLTRLCTVLLPTVIALYTIPIISAESIFGEDTSTVTDIEIANFKEIIKVGETVETTATVKPEEAAGQAVVFASSNPQTAEVSETGKITGISAGTTQITAEADGFQKTLSLTVKTGTQKLTVNASYLVLNPGTSYQLNVSVSPAETDQSITYRSTAKDIVAVSQDGKIQALKPGSGSVIVSTWDTSKIISVIVDNKGGTDTAGPDNNNDAPQQIVTEETQDKLDAVALKIALAGNDSEITVNSSECEIVNTTILRELFGTDKRLIINYSNYSISLFGRDIKNIENQLNTRLALSPAEQGLEVLVNDGYNLPGRLTIELKDQPKYMYLYLYDANKNTYNTINTISDQNEFSVDISGKYLLRQNKIADVIINWAVIAIIGVVGIGLIIAYIVIKKKHWFW